MKFKGSRKAVKIHHFRRSFQITRALLFTKFKGSRWAVKIHDFHDVFPIAKG